MTISLLQLLPILLGTFFAWMASGIIHMAIKWHNSDYQKLSNEDEVMDAIRKGSPGNGLHNFPYCIDMNEMKDESVQARFNKGPVGFVTIIPNGLPPMGKLMIQQISYMLIGCVLIAYCAALALEPGADYMTVFRFVGTVGFLAFGWGLVPNSIWFGQSWPTTFKYLVDALIYGLVVAGSFAWLWPSASM